MRKEIIKKNLKRITKLTVSASVGKNISCNLTLTKPKDIKLVGEKKVFDVVIAQLPWEFYI